MTPTALSCPGCLAPIDATLGPVSTCRYCGATIALAGMPAAAPTRPAPGALHLEDAGRNAIAVIKVIREFTGLGLKEAKDFVDQAPCLVAQWDDPARLEAFRQALTKAGARTR